MKLFRGPRRRPRRNARFTVAGQATALTSVVAVIAVLVAGAVLFGLVGRTTDAEARRVLARQADLIAGSTSSVADSGPTGDAGRSLTAEQRLRLSRVLRRQGIEVVRVDLAGAAHTAPEDITGHAVQAANAASRHREPLLAGEDVSATERVGDTTFLVEGRPLPNGSAIVLVQAREQSRAPARGLALRLGIALVIGLAAAAAAGAVLARRLNRPLRRVAGAALSLAGGRRDVRVPAEGPAEVVEVAVAINGLATALAVSEGRQRDFLLSVSHELRTPLTALRGFAESLADEVVTGPEVPAAAAVMVAESDRLSRLVSDLLDLARLGAQDFRLDLSEVDLTDLVRTAGQVWTARGAAAGLRVSVELPSWPQPVIADPGRVRQILDGLAENAVRATPAGRPVVLALYESGRPDLPGGGVVLEVRDGGPGLTADDYAVAFDKGVLHTRYADTPGGRTVGGPPTGDGPPTGRGRTKGSGIGLSLVAGLARRMGGEVSAGPAPEGGARFSVWLPRAAATQILPGARNTPDW